VIVRRALAARAAALLALAALAAVLALPAESLGAGARYDVVQCSAVHRGDEAKDRQPRAYHLKRRCGSRQDDNAMKIDNLFAAANGTAGAFVWIAPPQTAIVRVQAGAKLRRHSGHRARLVMTDAGGRETHRVASGDQGATTFRQRTWQGPPQPRFAARLHCMSNGGCAQSDLAKTWIRNIRLTLVDYADPVVTPSGSLLSSGWMRGVRELRAEFTDVGSGLAQAGIGVNETTLRDLDLNCGRVPGGTAAIELVPCSGSADLDIAPSTEEPPFRDGQNILAICATDFAGNDTCSARTIRVDNTPPSAAFANAQLTDDPELIRALVADAHSGVASGRISFRAAGGDEWQPLPTQVVGGELRARVDSAAYPPGPYEFRAEATDIAGNRGETVEREDGSPMVLSFPLRSGVNLHARIEPGGQSRVKLRYGRSVRAAGRLVARDGTPLADREITVEERFGRGALIDHRVRRVRTDERGRWRSRLPAGPSRMVRAHFDGDTRYLAREASAGSLAVRSRVRFKTSRRKVRQGSRVAFGGRIARRGARIPNGGKLLELQVRERPGRWSTVREAFRTGPRGRYRLRYRFGRFYQRNVRFRFRVKVAREGNWPYRASSSRSRSVTVLAK
jgi:hypothetical protein